MSLSLFPEKKQLLLHLFKNAFEQAGLSFSQMIQKPIKTQLVEEIPLNESFVYQFIPNFLEGNEDKDFALFTTKIKGDLNANSILVFLQEDMEKVASLCYKPSENRLSEVMVNATLLELDNILSASVVSLVSNFLNLNIYGYIPILETKSFQAMINTFQMEEELSPIVLAYHAGYEIENESIQAYFFWFFNEDLLSFLNK